MITEREMKTVESFVSFVFREMWPVIGLSKDGEATAAWSLYATTMANLQILVMRHGDAALIAAHRQALIDHCDVIKAIAECRSEHDVIARMAMEAETIQARGTDDWRPAAAVRG